MAPNLFPEDPSFDADKGAEKVVWLALKKTLPDEAWLLHGVRIKSRRRDHEGDLIVLWPGVGIAFIEVKGGTITTNPDGTFMQNSKGQAPRPIDPAKQAQDMIHELQRFVNTRTSFHKWTTSLPIVAFPYATLPKDYRSSFMDREQFIDKTNLSSPADTIKKALLDVAGYHPALSADDAQIIVQALSATVINAKDPKAIATLVDERTQLVSELVESNERLLDFAIELRSFEVLGPAGSGKTSLAVAHARRLTAQGKRVLYLTYSRLLADYLHHLNENLPKNERVAVITNFHQLSSKWGVKVPADADNEFWNKGSAREFTKLANAGLPDRKFDCIVVDESQDFDVEWWTAVKALFKDPKVGELYAYGDLGQGIFGKDGTRSLGLTPLRLHTNLRNAKPIADASNHLAISPAPSLGLDGPDVFYVEVPEEHDVIRFAERLLDDVLVTHLPENVALLTTAHRHPMQRELEKHRGTKGFVESFWTDKQVFYSTVAKFKGLERPAIVLVVDDFHQGQRPEEMLYVGMTRASDVLIVVSKRSMLEPHIDSDLMTELESNWIDLGDDWLDDLEGYEDD